MPEAVLAIIGRSGSGKTTLVAGLIAEFAARGLRVSTIKHTHHTVDLDRPGKDSWLHREAGAHEVMLASDQRFALLHEYRVDRPPDLAQLLARLEPVDLVMVEGFARYPCPRLEVQRSVVSALPGKSPLWPDDRAIEAVASDHFTEACDRVRLDLNDIVSVARWIASRFGLPDHFA